MQIFYYLLKNNAKLIYFGDIMESFKEKYFSEYKKWTKKFNDAKTFMESRKNGNRILIEVAAQHPLVDGEKPNEEFEKRLLFAIELFKQETKKGNYVEFYVPGSLHQYNGVPDKIELCEAGTKFLVDNGIDKNLVHGHDLNEKYKGNLGVYNSADECYVASQYFKDNNFNLLYSVLSPAQMYRKTLFYIEFGVLPLNFTAPTSKTFHNYIEEMFTHIPNVLFEDNSWQEMYEGSPALENRKDRNPNFKK